ncbi:MAG: GxxExxY protein [Chitinophagaceae bacterium]|nr:GxxExxY protein [Chitinophagaceae bacterium]
MIENRISNDIIGCSIQIHKIFDPGLLESAYKEFLYYDLIQMGYYVEKEKTMPVIYKEVKLNLGYRLDIVIEEMVVVEIKRVDRISDVHMAQLLTYMTLGGYKLGLIINFQTKLLKDGIKRIVI